MHSNTAVQTIKKNRNFVRLIAGQWKGRKLMISDDKIVRPTLNRLRETLFNWLMPSIQSAYCLDAFAGSGALGAEALSRGAAEVVFLEKSRHVFNQLDNNLRALSCDGYQLYYTDTFHWLNQDNPQPFDIILLDPPFQMDNMAVLCQDLEKKNWTKPGTLIYLESASDVEIALPDNWALCKEKRTNRFLARLFAVKD